MEKILDISSTLIEFDKEKSFFKVTRNISDIEDEQKYKKDIVLWINAILDYKPTFQLLDMQGNTFTISPEMQRWINENLIATAAKNGTKKIAFLVSSDIFARVSLEQTMDEEEAKVFTFRYFEDENEAMKWLF